MNFRHLIVAFILLPLGLHAAEGHYDDLFEKANEAYKEGAYDSAKSLYAEIAQNGMVSVALYYNLGNSYYKLGNHPAAILYYERALKLDPTDEDVQYNLEVANALITDQIEPLEEMFITSWWNGLIRLFSPSGWGAAFLMLLCLGLALLTLFFTARSKRIKQLGLLGGLSLLGLSTVSLALAQSAHVQLAKQEAIVFQASVRVKSEPSSQGSDQFVIHQGLKIEIVEKDGDWLRIRLSDGNSGWLPSQSIERI
jgi:tetratricopeptide (TPR) repeat protein